VSLVSRNSLIRNRRRIIVTIIFTIITIIVTAFIINIIRHIVYWYRMAFVSILVILASVATFGLSIHEWGEFGQESQPKDSSVCGSTVGYNM